jgi:maleate cis-trans isomerase
MMGWRARLGFLVPPGNPTVEPEMMLLAPAGVSLHFSRLVATGPTGTPEGQEERHRSYLEHIGASTHLLAMVHPDVIVLAHTASSYAMSAQDETTLLAQLQASSQSQVITAAGSVLAALHHLNVRHIALATPYAEEISEQGKRYLTDHGLHVVGYGRLENVRNIYEETAERAYRLARRADTPEADAVFISGTGLPTLSVLSMLEDDLGKPVISSATAMMWNALRLAGVGQTIEGYGRLLSMS